MTTRFIVLPDERKLILGRDILGLFDPGIIYSAVKINDEIILNPIGKTCLTDKANHCGVSLNSDIGRMIYVGNHLITEDEMESVIKDNEKDQS